MKALTLILGLLLVFPALACWRVTGSLGVDGETWKIDQKFDHNKEYLFPMGTFILKMTLKPGQNKNHTLVYALQEKNGLKLTDVTQGDEEIKEGENREIYAKGNEGQPNSIITIKIIHI